MNVNVPLPSGTSPDSYLGAFRRIVIPIIEQFDADWMLISSGFDAHVNDPLGGLRLEVQHYAAMARALGELVPASRTVSFLEGGYDLDAVAEGSRAVVEGSLGYWGDSLLPTEVAGSAARIVELTIEALAQQWELH